MKVSELQDVFLRELKELLPEWKFVKRDRHFILKRDDVVWFFHISFINHGSDFDTVGNVAVEYLSGKELVCIIGAELGNIEGSGQTRFPVSSSDEAISSAKGLYDFFVKVGKPFYIGSVTQMKLFQLLSVAVKKQCSSVHLQISMKYKLIVCAKNMASACNKALLLDKFTAALQTCRRARR